MKRRMNDGDMTGLKQDRFRNSRWEYEPRNDSTSSGSPVKTSNTIGGAYQENRGRRSASDEAQGWEGSPYEDGRINNWNRRQGWDDQYDRRRFSDSRKHGGRIIEDTSHSGKGPKGYGRSNEAIYEDVCEILTRSPDVDASHIDVEVKDGVVYLTGDVADRMTKKITEYLIESISGVRDVQNLLSFGRSEELH